MCGAWGFPACCCSLRWASSAQRQLKGLFNVKGWVSPRLASHACRIGGTHEVIQACTLGHPKVLPALVWAKSYFPEVALPGKAFLLGLQSEGSSLSQHDLTSGRTDTGAITL